MNKYSEEFILENVISNKKPIIIYPAGKGGKIIFNILKFIGIKIKYFCDQNLKGQYCGVDIISPKELVQEYGDCNIIISSSSHYFEIVKFLNKNNINKIYDVSNLLKDPNIENNVIKLNKEFITIMNSYTNIIEYYKSNGKILPSLDLMVTEKCSLKCRNCSNLMQYYKNPQNYKIEQIVKSLDNVLKCVKKIKELRLIGGEPFMNKELYKVIDLYNKEDKIDKIVIFTNATIIPNEINLEALKSHKVEFYITDYGSVSRNLEKLIIILKSNNIKYFLNKPSEWKLYKDIKKRDIDKKQIKEIYTQCCCKTFLTLIKGKLYCCPFLANAMNINGIPDNKNEYVDCNMEDIDLLKGEIKEVLFNNEYFQGCAFCGGRNGNEKSIEPAIQINTPLNYTIY